MSDRENSYVAIKILKGFTASLVPSLIWELEALKRLSSSSSSPTHCLQLLSDFTLPGKGSAGQHLCFVTPVLGGDVQSLFGSRDQPFPLPLVKRILLHVLRGIAHAHKCGVVHTDLKLDNIFFSTSMTTKDFETLLASDPPRRHPPEASHDWTVEVAVSQPLPFPTLEDAMKRNFVLGDLGSAQSITDHKVDEITPYSLRPPEIMICGPWNEKVDIWTFGCLVFEFVTGRVLFKYEPYPKFNLDAPTYLLYLMLCYTCEDFGAEQLTVSRCASKFFDLDCNLTARPPIANYPFEICIRTYKVVDEADVLSTAALMRRCLHLDPAERASAVDLLSDTWFNGVD